MTILAGQLLEIFLHEGKIMKLSVPAGTTGTIFRLSNSPGGSDSYPSVAINGANLSFGPYPNITRFRIVVNAGVVTESYVNYSAGAGAMDGTDAQAGAIGELITATAAPAAVSLTTATPANIVSVSLTAGDWDVEGVVNYTPGASTSITQLSQGVSVTSATLGVQDSYAQQSQAANVPGANIIASSSPEVRLSLAVTTTVYLVAKATFTVSTLTGGGTIRARRMR